MNAPLLVQLRHIGDALAAKQPHIEAMLARSAQAAGEGLCVFYYQPLCSIDCGNSQRSARHAHRPSASVPALPQRTRAPSLWQAKWAAACQSCASLHTRCIRRRCAVVCIATCVFVTRGMHAPVCASQTRVTSSPPPGLPLLWPPSVQAGGIGKGVLDGREVQQARAALLNLNDKLHDTLVRAHATPACRQAACFPGQPTRCLHASSFASLPFRPPLPASGPLPCRAGSNGCAGSWRECSTAATSVRSCCSGGCVGGVGRQSAKAEAKCPAWASSSPHSMPRVLPPAGSCTRAAACTCPASSWAWPCGRCCP